MATAYYSDLKWTVVVAVAVMVFQLNSLEDRLYDLVIRTQRTTKLLRQSVPADE